MADLTHQFTELQLKTARIRQDFLLALLQNTFTALEMADFELSIGNIEVVEKELVHTQKACSAIERFVAGLKPEQRSNIDFQLAHAKDRHKKLANKLRGGGH